MAGISAANLLNCRDASMLLGAFNMIANDDNGEVKQLFFAPGRQRLELLRWVLTAIDPSGKTEQELGAGDGTREALTERISSVLKRLNPARAQDFAAFAEGTAADSDQTRLWHMLLGTAEMVQNSEGSSASSTFSRPCSGSMTFKPMVASTPMPQVGPSVVSSSSDKREGKAAKCLWHSDNGARPSDKSTVAEEDPLDVLIKQLEESIRVDKAMLAAAAASPEPEEPPLDHRLCASYRQAAERLVKAGKSLMQGPPSHLPPLVLDDKDGRLVAAARASLEALKSNLFHATLLNALEGHAKNRSCGTRFK
ncbi:uncharacterized protein [Dermacentor andersoni]|uniref:uncharacterized protein n=1 Tax=Dermacentor andersoni TaxID=34620 RepID=UPI002417FBCB|nr:uncharacterized protein LOC126534825 [Dermacentor andersoni]